MDIEVFGKLFARMMYSCSVALIFQHMKHTTPSLCSNLVCMRTSLSILAATEEQQQQGAASSSSSKDGSMLKQAVEQSTRHFGWRWPWKCWLGTIRVIPSLL
jgi:hypothetical protein